MSTAELKQIQQMLTPIETRIINRALNVLDQNYFDFTYTGMYSEFTKLMVKVRDKRSHVFIASEFAMDFYTKQTETFGFTVHMARDEYFDRPYGFLIHKDSADSILAIQLNQILKSSLECGLFSKMREMTAKNGFKLYGDLNYKYKPMAKSIALMTMDAMKIAIGPYLCVQKIMEIPKYTNIYCDVDIGYETEPYVFNYDFKPIGNFTATWMQMAPEFEIKLLCSMDYFLLKELVRRTRYGAIMLETNKSRVLNLPGYNYYMENSLKYVYAKDVDILLDRYQINDQMLQFGDILGATNYPALSILGAIRVKQSAHRYLMIIGILFVVKLIILTIINEEILSFTITNPYKVIDSLEDLELRPKVEPRLYLASADLNSIRKRATPLEMRVLKRALSKYEQNYVDIRWGDFFYKLSAILDGIRAKRNEAVIMWLFNAELIMKQVDAYTTVHLAREQYYQMGYGHIVNKQPNNPVLSKHFADIVKFVVNY
ncbi:unnamed protein product [Medioppia subpectinata]|uniref:Uncharacterized protein n=1 Tax=Medioppia subpectinata TaxID=1979941 RepID=A0A7R9KK65_9ACAR|nr:unnamed protein product [Medioppia subpectinata]CAG2103789.1 unnamed protein product [Medioppia subpectinata]